MKRGPFLSTLAVAFAVVSALLSNFNLLFQKASALDSGRIGKDAMTLQERRFEPLKNALPRHGRVGYVSNLKADDIYFDPGIGEYYSTQYALAPLVVVYSLDEPLVVGNFRGRAPISIPALRGAVIVKDFGRGVLLYRKEAK